MKERMYTDTHCAFQPGRCILGRLPKGADLVKAVCKLAERTAVTQAVFSIVGCVSSVTTGVFDQNQQVYITDQFEEPFDIVACRGSICRRKNESFVHVHAVLVGNDGRVYGGRLFSPTQIFTAEITLNELEGPKLQRAYDPTTGMMLWSF